MSQATDQYRAAVRRYEIAEQRIAELEAERERNLDSIRVNNLIHEKNSARIAELEAALRKAREALRWVVDQGGGPICEHEAAVCFCKENSAINTANELLKD